MQLEPMMQVEFFLLAEARTNSLILRAPTVVRGNLARSLIARLDQPTALPGNVHVVYLKNSSILHNQSQQYIYISNLLITVQCILFMLV